MSLEVGEYELGQLKVVRKKYAMCTLKRSSWEENRSCSVTLSSMHFVIKFGCWPEKCI